MRPVNRGDKPTNDAGELFTASKYQEFRGFLLDRLGSYCSYCERPLSHNAAVEHIRPKDTNPTLEKEWSNLLLACTNCNSTKGDQAIILGEYCWPDKDNTAFAYIYSSAGRIEVNPNLEQTHRSMALKMIKLVGLDKEPSSNPSINPEQKDRRWRERRDTWQIAERSLERLKRNNSVDYRELIVELAVAKGYFSIWMSVFINDLEMLKLLIKGFKGTAAECYDDNCCYLKRSRGAF